MRDERRQRLADNESAFREINERIERRVEHWKALEDGLHSAICECCDSECVDRIKVTPSEHRMARSRCDRFLIAPRHENADIERVVYRHDRYWIVQKHRDLVAAS
jgi:hypothetical protein